MKRKFIFVLCFCLMLVMAPMSVYAHPGDGGNTLIHMYTDKDLTYDEDATVFIYATPGACEIVDEGGNNAYQRYRVTNFEGWYFEGWKTWYTGREYHWIFPDANEVNKENPKYDSGTGWYFSQWGLSQHAYTANIYDYMKERIQVNKEPGYRGTYYLYAIFRPVLTVNAGDGVSCSVSGAYQVPGDGDAAAADRFAVLYNGNANVTYKVDPAYEVTGITASYGTSYSVSGQTITVSNMVRPGSISINTEKKHVHDYSSAWSSDENAHWRECSCGEKTDNGTHSGGTATCTETALCAVCGKNYGSVDKQNHAGGVEIRNAVSADEFTEGYTGDVYCKGCGDLISKGQVIPASHQHSYSTDWSSDGSSHWHECSCGVKEGAAAHSFSDATCTEPMKCSVCGFISGEAKGHDYTDANCKAPATCTGCGDTYGEPDKSRHKGELEIRGAVAAEEFKDGYTGDVYCLDCGSLVKKGEVIPKTGSDEPADPADKDPSSDEQNKDKVTDKDVSPKTGDDRTATVYWIVLVAALLVIRRIFKNKRS